MTQSAMIRTSGVLIAILLVGIVLVSSAADRELFIHWGCINLHYDVDYSCDLRSASRRPWAATLIEDLHSPCSTTRSSSRTSSMSVLEYMSDTLPSPSSISDFSDVSSAYRSDDVYKESNVFLARCRSDQREVVVKRIRKIYDARGNGNRDKILGEAQSMALLDQVGTIPRLYDVIENETHICLVMQYFRGRSLRQYIADLIDAKPRMTCEAIFERLNMIADSVAGTLLQFFHFGVHCRDINALNVLIGDDDNVIVIDLGYSQFFFQQRKRRYLSMKTWKDSQFVCFRALLKNLFAVLPHDRFTAVELCQQPLYRRVQHKPHDEQGFDNFKTAASIKAQLTGQNATRRYDDFVQHTKLMNWPEPVLSAELKEAQRHFIATGESFLLTTNIHVTLTADEHVDLVRMLYRLGHHNLSQTLSDWIELFLDNHKEDPQVSPLLDG